MSTKSYETSTIDKYLSSRRGLDALLNEIEGDKNQSYNTNAPQMAVVHDTADAAQAEQIAQASTLFRRNLFSEADRAELEDAYKPKPVVQPLDVTKYTAPMKSIPAEVESVFESVFETDSSGSFEVETEFEIPADELAQQAADRDGDVHEAISPSPIIPDEGVTLISQVEIDQMRMERKMPNVSEEKRNEHIESGTFGADELEAAAAEKEGRPPIHDVPKGTVL